MFTFVDGCYQMNADSDSLDEGLKKAVDLAVDEATIPLLTNGYQEE